MTYRHKRCFDLAIASVCAVPCMIVGLPCAVIVKLTSRGPVLFKQERIGRDGVPFVLLKFRTMVHRSDNPVYPDPSRITIAGRWMRRLSLDEVPQLINVFRGEMSIVGPRPTLAYQVSRYDSEQFRRLSVPPGITGLAQVQGRNALDWPSRIKLDLKYIDQQSLTLDMKILWWTSLSLVRGSGIDGHPRHDPVAGVRETEL